MSNQPKKSGMKQVVLSVLGAFFGVQSEKTRQRDFSQSNPWIYVAVGICFVILFVLAVYGLVQVVLHTANIKS